MLRFFQLRLDRLETRDPVPPFARFQRPTPTVSFFARGGTPDEF